MKKIVFTDLDGTLLDPITYSYQIAKPLIEKIKEAGIPIIFCTAKTRVENEYYQRKLKINGPFIAENGGAIFIPKNYFSFPLSFQKTSKKYHIIELGAPYKKLRDALQKIRKETKFKIKGFGDMNIEEVAEDTGLTKELAKLAKRKEYNESFNFYESSEKEKILHKKVRKAGLKLTHGGRYYDLIGKNAGKGKTVKILTKLFEKEFRNIQTIGIGDSLNDMDMLKVVDIPILVQNKEGIWNPKIKVFHLNKVGGIGPRGWKKAIQKFIIK